MYFTSGAKEATLNVANRGIAPLQFSGLSVSDPRYTTELSAMQVAPGQSAEIKVQLGADKEAINGELCIATNDPAQPVRKVQVAISSSGSSQALGQQAVDFTLFFRQLTRVAGGEDSQTLTAMFCSSEPFKQWFAKWRREADPAKYLADMRAANPILIPRNHRVAQAIQSAYTGDFAQFHRLVDALAEPYADQVEYADLETPPRPEEIVHETFCGT